jgi:SAM-dependent methyltransferase
VSTPSNRQRVPDALVRAMRRARVVGRNIGATRPADQAVEFAREGPAAELAAERRTVTEMLYDRLGTEDVEQAEQLVREQPGAWSHYFGDAERAEDHGLLLALALWVGSEAVTARTGLIHAEPPEDVHAMTRGAQNAAGGLYEADMVIDALLGAGVELDSIEQALDFGCSSGRVLRPLAAAFPSVRWHGCDANERAIGWAGETFSGIEFFVSHARPPLALVEAQLDLAYAISIWSHFSPERGLEWLEEMRRVIKPGGHLVLTTHGLESVAHYVSHGLRSPEQSREIGDSLYRCGWWYAAEFGATGDWGVVDSDWGTAFLSPEWLLAQLTPAWRVLEFAPGRNQGNQDVYVLQRA